MPEKMQECEHTISTIIKNLLQEALQFSLLKKNINKYIIVYINKYY